MSTVVMHLTRAVMLAGSYNGKRIQERLPEGLFIVLIELVLIISGLTCFSPVEQVW
ncbi:MAG TPA: hypothetical protein VH186_16510 [Chloroflexia bacterium]|nr:hypothetical protein [Chloroflexia bacterium]